MEDRVIRYVDRERAILQDIEQMQAEIARASEAIQTLQNPTYIDILTQRYIMGRTAREVGDSLGVTPQYVSYMTGKAIKILTDAKNS